MASNYEKAKNLLWDNGPYRTKEERLAEAGVRASLAVAEQIMALRQELAGADEQ